MKNVLSLLTLLLFGLVSNASIVIVNGLSHEHVVQVGTKSQGSIVIKNTAETEKRAKIYKTDVEHSCNGQTVFTITESRDRCNSAWTLLSDNEIVIPGKQTYTLTYEIDPSKDAVQNGSYWGVIMVEEIKNLDTLTPQRGVTVTSLIRYAIQIVTHFEKDNIKNLEIKTVDIDTTKEETLLAVGIDNTGNYMLKPIMILELYNENGEQVYRNEIPYQKVYPGFCKLFEIPIVDVPRGTYNGILVADCGDENIYGINLELDIPEAKSKE
jgi:hypothetical protein